MKRLALAVILAVVIPMYTAASLVLRWCEWVMERL